MKPICSRMTSTMSFIQWRRIGHHHAQPYIHIKDTKSPVMHTTGGKDDPNIVFMWKSQRTSQQETKYTKTHTGQHKKLQRWATQTPQNTGGTLDRQAGFFHKTSVVCARMFLVEGSCTFNSFKWRSCCSIFSFCAVIYRSLFVL